MQGWGLAATSDIVWFQDGTPLVENLETNLIRFLEGGRWAYIRDIETFPRDYHCEVSNARMHESVRSPQTYFVNGTGLVTEVNFVYKETGDLTAFSKEGENENFEFSYVSSQGTLNRVCAFSNNGGSSAVSNAAVGTITNLPAPPAEVTLECRDGQIDVISIYSLVEQSQCNVRTPTPPHTHTHTHPHTHTHKRIPTPTHTYIYTHRKSRDNDGSLKYT